jgi:hypothetical protein
MVAGSGVRLPHLRGARRCTATCRTSTANPDFVEDMMADFKNERDSDTIIADTVLGFVLAIFLASLVIGVLLIWS